MKLFLSILLFLLFSAGISFARQQDYKIPRQVLTTADEMPEFPGGKDAMNRFMAKNLHYPKRSVEMGTQGKVIVKFIVEIDGSLSDIELVQSVDADCDKETLRVINKMPKWNPGRHQGAAAAIYYTMPVTFSLE